MIRRILTGLTVLALPAIHACQVPVFRYALERWAADPYELVVFSKGETPGEIRSLPDNEPTHVNLETLYLDVNTMTDSDRAIYGNVTLNEGETKAHLYFPRVSKMESPLWKGPPTRESFAVITDSPTRQSIRDKLLAGESAVWVLLESGNPSADDTAEKQLRASLAHVVSQLTIPEGVAGPGSLDRVTSGEVAIEDVLRSKIPLKISFDVVRPAKNDPEETFFLSMLETLAAPIRDEFPDTPIVFPVFGRGRTIEGIPAPMINDDVMMRACEYLCSACSCEVKQENPGVDLLMRADWEKSLEGSLVVVEKELPPLEGAGDLIDASKTKTPSAKKSTAPSTSLPLLKNLAWIALAVFGMVAIVSFLIAKRPRNES